MGHHHAGTSKNVHKTENIFMFPANKYASYNWELRQNYEFMRHPEIVVM